MVSDSLINKDKVLRLVSHLDQALEELDSLSQIDRATVLTTRERFAMEQLFYRAAMSCIDLCYHIVSRSKEPVPETYRGFFQQLVLSGIILPDLGTQLEKLAGLRNIIAHAYISLDYGQLYDYLNELDGLRKFRDVVISIAA